MLLMAITILFGYSSQSSAQTAQDNYLDLANYETIGKPTSRLVNYYVFTPNEENNTAWLTMSAYGAYHAFENNNTNGVKNSWIGRNNIPAYSSMTWNAESAPFSGSAVFFGNNQAQAFGHRQETNDQNTPRELYFYVKSCTEISLIGKNTNNTNASSSIVVTEGTFNGNSFIEDEQVANPRNSTLSASVNLVVSGLDYNKIYRVTVKSYRSYIYEIAFKTKFDPRGTAFGSYLDITKYQTIDAAGWRTNLVKNLYKYTEYPNDNCAWLTLPVYGAYVGTSYAPNSSTSGSGHPQKWIDFESTSNNIYYGATWSNTASSVNPFNGSSTYFSSNPQALGRDTKNSTSLKKISFYVTNTTEVKLYGKGRSGVDGNHPASLKIYECTENANGTLTVGTSAVVNLTSSSTGTFTLTAASTQNYAIDANTIYKVEASIYRGGLYEIAFKTPLEVVTADWTDLEDFWQAPDFEHTQSFELTAKNIKHDGSTNNAFVFTPAKVTAEEARANKGKINVSVSFVPTAYGNYSSDISVNYNNVAKGNRTLSGKSEYFTVNVSDAAVTTLYYDKPLVIPYRLRPETEYETYPDLGNVIYVRALRESENDLLLTSLESVKKKDVKGTDQFINPKENAVIVFAGGSGEFKFPIYNDYNSELPTQLDPENLLKGSLENISVQNVIDEAKRKGAADPIVLTLGRRPGGNVIGFYHYIGTDLSKNKAYLIYDRGSSANTVNFFSIGGYGSEYTVIQETETMTGQREDGAWYTLQGVRLNDKPTQRGLYLHNGKKIMVK